MCSSDLNDDDRYFGDTFQFMPNEGYTRMFERMLDHPNISVHTSKEFDDARSSFEHDHIVYTGPIDAFFNHCHGRLPYRSLRFEHSHLQQQDDFQAVGTVNYPNDHAYTRITEFKHLTGQRCAGTSIVREYPQAEGEPFYPIPRPETERLYKQYLALAEATPHTTFIGRLAQYKYYNMDQVGGAALEIGRAHV